MEMTQQFNRNTCINHNRKHKDNNKHYLKILFTVWTVEPILSRPLHVKLRKSQHLNIQHRLYLMIDT